VKGSVVRRACFQAKFSSVRVSVDVIGKCVMYIRNSSNSQYQGECDCGAINKF